MTSWVISIFLRSTASFGSSLRNGTSEPKASECITTRMYGWRPCAADAANRSRMVSIAAARFSSSAAFMLMYSASAPLLR
jgi:hypothetical protein